MGGPFAVSGALAPPEAFSYMHTQIKRLTNLFKNSANVQSPHICAFKRSRQIITRLDETTFNAGYHGQYAKMALLCDSSKCAVFILIRYMCRMVK